MTDILPFSRKPVYLLISTTSIPGWTRFKMVQSSTTVPYFPPPPVWHRWATPHQPLNLSQLACRSSEKWRLDVKTCQVLYVLTYLIVWKYWILFDHVYIQKLCQACHEFFHCHLNRDLKLRQTVQKNPSRYDFWCSLILGATFLLAMVWLRSSPAHWQSLHLHCDEGKRYPRK